jgi:hypothetical protein
VTGTPPGGLLLAGAAAWLVLLGIAAFGERAGRWALTAVSVVLRLAAIALLAWYFAARPRRPAPMTCCPGSRSAWPTPPRAGGCCGWSGGLTAPGPHRTPGAMVRG